jgi:general secretion pathway protein A
MGFSVLSGEVGTGKTTITREFLNRLEESVESALLVNPLLSIPELLRAINKDFGNPVRNLSPQRQIESLNKFLLKLHGKGKNAVVIIDEAQNLSFEALEMLRMLSNLETDTEKLLQVVLVGQPELIKKLESHKMRQLNQRITVRCNLVPLKFIEMVRYINHRIVLAGGQNKVFIEAKSYKIIYNATKGFPRLINVICDRSLVAAYTMNTATITPHLTKQAIRDIQGSVMKPAWKTPILSLRRKLVAWLN